MSNTQHGGRRAKRILGRDLDYEPLCCANRSKIDYEHYNLRNLSIGVPYSQTCRHLRQTCARRWVPLPPKSMGLVHGVQSIKTEYFEECAPEKYFNRCRHQAFTVRTEKRLACRLTRIMNHGQKRQNKCNRQDRDMGVDHHGFSICLIPRDPSMQYRQERNLDEQVRTH